MTNEMQKEKPAIWKNSVYVLLSQIIRLLTNFLIFIGIARIYGPSDLGQFSIAFTIANLCLVLADFGFDLLIITQVSKNLEHAAEIAKRFFSIKVVLAGVAFTLMLIIPALSTFSYGTGALILSLSLYVVFTTFNNFYYALFRGFERFDYETKISFITNLSLLASLIIFGILKTSLVYMMFLFVGARLFGSVLCVLHADGIIGREYFKINFADSKEIINQVMIYGLFFLFGNLYFQVETILIGIIKGDYSTGIYQSAFRIMLLILLIPDIARGAILPGFSRLYEEDLNSWKKLSELFFKIILFAGMFISLIVYFFPGEIISSVYGLNQYRDAVPVLRIFAGIVLVRFIGEPFVLIILTSRKQHIMTLLVTSASLISIAVNYYVVSNFSLPSVAYVALGINILVVAGYTAVNYRFFWEWVKEKRALTIIAVAIILFVYNNLLGREIILMGIGLIFYAAAVIFIGFSKRDIKILKDKFILHGI